MKYNNLIKGFFFWLPLIALLLVSYFFIYRDYKIYDSDNVIYVPLKRDSIHIDRNEVSFKYKPFIPLDKVSPSYGKAVVYINSFGVASFVRKYKTSSLLFSSPDVSSELSFGEQLLAYQAVRPISLYPKMPQLSFGALSYPLFAANRKQLEQNITAYSKSRYAVLLTNKDTGQAVLIGLADRNYAFIKPRR